MRFGRSLVVFTYGLFTIASQTVLFREFLGTFEGNDIGVGIFFGSWFLWVGVGALCAYKFDRLSEKLLRHIEVFFLAYIPAFILQLVLIIHARQLAGVESYALMPIKVMVFLSILVNAPVSIITGLFFPLACRWVQRPLHGAVQNHSRDVQTQKLPVSRVYLLEAAGSFLGGVGVTILLSLGATLVRIFLILIFLVALSVSLALLNKARKLTTSIVLSLSLCIFSFFGLVSGIDSSLMQHIRAVKWARLLPEGELRGSLQTSQAEYLYGSYRGQWLVVREGSVCEAIPDHESAGRIAAIHLCQNPSSKNVLIIGSGLNLCREFLRLGQIENVSWAHIDSEYIGRVNSVLPAELKLTDSRFTPIGYDVRLLLAERKQYYDLVIVNLPDATSSILNRYYTQQFYRLAKESLRQDGVLGVRVSGGANIMGTELVNLGASVKLTLEKVFSQLVITPGEETFFLASDSAGLTGQPGEVQDRFASIQGAADVFPPAGLLSVYLPNRAAGQLQSYATADLPENLLLNDDSRPLAHLYSLLLTAKQSGAPVTKIVKHFALAGVWPVLCIILVGVVLRMSYVLKTHRQGAPTAFENMFLVFSAGLTGIGVVIVLMYLYQTRFGSLYLHVGLISSIFMVGLTAGAGLIRHLLIVRQRRREPLLFGIIVLHIVILGAIAFWPLEHWSRLAFVAAFALCGLCTGCYFPLAASGLAEAAFETGAAASKLEMADHIGAAAGGFLTGLAIVPILGTRVSLLIFTLLILVNVPLAALAVYKREEFRSLATAKVTFRKVGYCLFGIGASVILCSNLLTAAGAALKPLLSERAAQALAGASGIERATVVCADGKKISYFKVYEPNEKLAGYIFSSAELAPEVRGFGGKINLAVHIDTSGKLIGFEILSSNETPSYLRLLNKWQDSLEEHNVFEPGGFVDVEAVTGATVSSKAVVAALKTSGRTFATQILGQTVKTIHTQKPYWAGYLPDVRAIYLLSAMAIALFATYYGGFASRVAVLALTLLVGGVVLNAQYSSEQIAGLLSFNLPAIALSGPFLLVLAVPVLTLIFGNLYCGYICPFGAAQELLSYIIPRRYRPAIPLQIMHKAGFVKYVLLFVLTVVFFLSRNRTTLASEPLIEIFNFQFTIYDFRQSMLLIGAIALIGSIFYVRFWCRYLCPVGAFLSLLSGIAVLRRYLPAKKIGRCEFGITSKAQLDCLYCDRCRYEGKTTDKEKVILKGPMQPFGKYLLIPVLATALLITTISTNRFLQAIPKAGDYSGAAISGGGEPRNVDLQRIRSMIREKKLSGREAEFYKKLEEPSPAPPQ